MKQRNSGMSGSNMSILSARGSYEVSGLQMQSLETVPIGTPSF